MCTVPLLEVTSISELQPLNAAVAANSSSGETTVFMADLYSTVLASKQRIPKLKFTRSSYKTRLRLNFGNIHHNFML